jgi:hypothetical protein
MDSLEKLSGSWKAALITEYLKKNAPIRNDEVPTSANSVPELPLIIKLT